MAAAVVAVAIGIVVVDEPGAIDWMAVFDSAFVGLDQMNDD